MSSTLKCTSPPIAKRYSTLVVLLTTALSIGIAAHAHAATPALAKPGAPTDANAAADAKST